MSIRRAVVGGVLSMGALGGAAWAFHEARDASADLVLAQACQQESYAEREMCADVVATPEAIDELEEQNGVAEIATIVLTCVGAVGITASTAESLGALEKWGITSPEPPQRPPAPRA